MLIKQEKRSIRHKRTRAKVFGTKDCPRLSVFRSNKFLRAQIIDDEGGKSLLQLTDFKTRTAIKTKKTKLESARELGKKLATEAKKKKINKVVFDKGGYTYHGRVKALADGAREGGLSF